MRLGKLNVVVYELSPVQLADLKMLASDYRDWEERFLSLVVESADDVVTEFQLFFHSHLSDPLPSPAVPGLPRDPCRGCMALSER